MSANSTEWLLRVPNSHVEKTRILCSLTPGDFFFGAESRLASEIEPPPLLDYHTIHMMIGICRQFLDKHDIKRWDYLADSRKNYFEVHQQFYKAFNSLQDAEAYELITTEKKKELELQIQQAEVNGTAKMVVAKKKRDLEDLVWSLAKNRLEMPALAEALRRKAKVRDHAASWLSNMKMQLLRQDLPALVYLVRQVFQNKQRYQAKEGE